jgi:hypothetical protein
MSTTGPRHPALAARILTLGLSATAALGLVALFARDSQRTAPTGSTRLVEVRIGDEVDDDEARSALREWLEGRSDLTTEGGLTVVDLPADAVSEPS